ncbi:hypothetical protein J4441_02595 [Candidatus Micrarchaeota archaeon]|nr:hypothetical protein [Candidatus Micrarchaeota archaeon]
MKIWEFVLSARFAYLLGVLFVGVSFAQTSALSTALHDLCVGINNLVPVAAMLMVLLASVIYAVGQMMGAETRARANVWATSCLTGAIVGILIATIAPEVLRVMNDDSAIEC